MLRARAVEEVVAAYSEGEASSLSFFQLSLFLFRDRLLRETTKSVTKKKTQEGHPYEPYCIE